ncbi:hypothetical protein FA95DRAFT_1573343 [Auriscalpium vulgare]|uniref:Uncharacterized protein n=1 Tax=Auriscalpium vulgare TaxID=40419 RepID=A0ACB8RR02_9AGAM|nr:hypothetical protein FA95DRAFT_1573343 [Auriscalpium vulgare]
MSTRSTSSKTMNNFYMPDKAIDRVLAYMPTEIFHEITDWIDSPDDLRAFTLTCRLFAAIASPRHTQLRSLRCPVKALCVWEALAADAALARNVRHIDIQNGHFPVGGWHLPVSFCKTSADCWHCSRYDHFDDRGMWERVEKPMITALTNMSNLLSLKWKSHLYNFPLERSANDQDDIWTALRSCSSMTALSVEEGDFGEIFHYTNIFTLSNLTSFEYKTETFGFEGLPSDGEALGIMLRERCPKLQTLKLCFPDPISEGYAPPLFGKSVLSGQWPDLDCRQFAGMNISDITDKDLVELPLMLPPAVLPNLQTLRCAPGHAADILASMKTPETGTPHSHVTVTLTDFPPWHPRMRDLCMVGVLTDTETMTLNATAYVRGMIASAGRSAVAVTEL